MSKASIPTVFVSSTCYDLRQVRADIKAFIESFGFSSMLSEYSSFPIDPDIGTVENCLNAVQEYATLFILVVGGRYGSINDQGKSITNLEYLQAKAKGAPVYVFVQRSVLDILPVWKSNPDANFQNVVDSPKLFEFVAGLRDSQEVWVFPFDTAQDITDTLREQWAHLFFQSLQLRMQARAAGLSNTLSQLQGPALQIVIERPLLWEHRLFSEVLASELAQSKQIKMDLGYGIAFGKTNRLPTDQLFDWLSTKQNDLGRIVSSLSRLINVAVQEAMGPPGVPGDAESLIYVARRVAEAYRALIAWSIDFQHIDVEEDFQNLIKIASRFSSNAIKEIEEFSDYMQRTIKEAIASIVLGQKRTLEFNLTLTISGVDELEEELDRIREIYGF